MSLAHNPSIATNGLIMYYDMNNTQKSWKGSPTTNLITYPQADWNGSSFALTYDYKGNGVGNATQTFDTSVETPLVGDYSGVMKYTTGSAGITTYPDGYKYWAIRISGLTAGTTYTFSYYAKASIASNFANSQLWRDTGTDYNPSGDWNPTFTTEWKRYSTTRAIVGTYLDYFPIHSGNLTGGHTIYYWGFQMEVGSFATPFVVGTRSSTQAIVDLTGKNTLTATSLTYNSNGTFSFNASTNYIETTNNIITGNNPFTFECFYTLTGQQGGEIFGNYGTGYSSSNYIWISGMYGLYIGGAVYFPGAPIANGTYYMACSRDASGNCVLYKNGVQVTTGTLASSIAAGPNFRIGADTTNAGGMGAEPFSGTIYSQKLYNRVLTAAEIAQNFNAHRGRYGL